MTTDIVPSAPPASGGRRRVALGWSLRVLTWIGTVLILFAGWSLWGTGLRTARAQDRLTDDFVRSLPADVPTPAETVDEIDPDGDGPAEMPRPEPTFVPLDEEAPKAPEGAAVALLKIPKIGVQQAVVEGTTFRSLAKGPGHYTGTPLPGEPGNVAIAGHRTTYGAPFFHLDKLGPGDLLLVTTRGGVFRYRVTETKVIRPSQREVLLPKGDDRLTLTTCHPAFRATERLVVTAHPEGSAPATASMPPPPEPATDLTGVQVPSFDEYAALPAPIPTVKTIAPRPPADRVDGPTLGGEGAASGDLAPVAGWTAFVMATWAGMLRLGRRRRWATRLVGTPVLLGGLVGAFEAVALLLPGGL